MNNKLKRLMVALGALLTPLCGIAAAPAPAQHPDLVLLVVVDQLRGDMPWRFRDRFGEGGFRYLMEQGTSFSNAQYQHANTLTASGHATLATGGNSPQHGLAGNDWFDAATRRAVYCMEDPGHPQLGGGAGRSPRNLLSSTFGDELVLASGGRSRVFSVSLKDRSAIILGGRLGKAYWYSKTDGSFATSSYYHDAEPDWMRRWNDAKPAEHFRDTIWQLLQEPARYVFADQDERSYERPPVGLGRTFPHALVGGDDAKRFMGQVNEALKSRFGTERDLALAFWNPGIYLDLAAIAEQGLNTAMVERVVAGEILGMPGFALAFTRSDLLAGRYPSTQEAARVVAGFNADRSGNVIVVPSPFWYLEKDPEGNAAMHGSLYRYDTHVPLMLAGPGVGRRVVQREVAPRDLAPTLSAYLGIAPPSGSVGVLLEEVWE